MKDLDRLLRSAANAPEAEAPAEAPFGFDTRVIAAWRSDRIGKNDLAELSRFLRQAGVVACAVLVIAGAAAYRQYREETSFVALPSNEYAIVDSAIQTEFFQ